MDKNFWINKWNENQIGFHKDNYHEALVKFYPLLKIERGEKVLVPLCGKTRDLIFFSQKELTVRGIELYEKAVKSFFEENEITGLEVSQNENFIDYKKENLTISCGDIFKLDSDEAFDLVYDRASLVALPYEMRMRYSELITKVIKKGGKYLLIAYEYDQEKLSGPPFSVSLKEIEELYGNDFKISLLEDEKPSSEGPRLSTLESFTQKVYLLIKR